MLVCAACAVAQRRRVLWLLASALQPPATALSLPSSALWLTAFVAGIALGGAGCAKRETPVQAGIRTQALLVGNVAEPADLDPHVVGGGQERNIMHALFEGLTAPDKDGNGIPAAAERWEVSADGLRWTFHLRPNLRWSNGDALTAADFVFSFQRVLTPGFPATDYGYWLWHLKGGEAFSRGRSGDFSSVGAKALDDRTLRLELARPTPYLPALACQWTWLPVHRPTLEKFSAVAKRGTRWTRPGNLVGNGPFTLTAWEPHARIVVSKNFHYWNAGRIQLNQIVFFPIEKPEVEENSFRAGQLHVTWEVPEVKISGYRVQQPTPLVLQPVLGPEYLFFNVTQPPLDNPRVRRALALAIDQEMISRAVTRGTFPPAFSFTPPNCGGYTARTRIRCDFAEARKLLADAGFSGGKGLPPLSVQTREVERRVRTLEAIQAMWQRELGVRLTIERTEHKVLLDNVRAKSHTIGLLGWPADYPDPAALLEPFVTGGTNNWTGWSNPAYDRLIDEAANTADQQARFELFQRAEALLLEEAPVAPILFITRAHLVHPAVKNWSSTVLDQRVYARASLSN